MTSLQNKCLNIIFNNFDEYHSIYTSAPSSCDKLKLEFLQRKYSVQLAEKLYNEHSFHQKYMDFVINRFLKSLDTSWLEKFEWEVVCKKFFEIGPSLEKVRFDRDHPWEEVIMYLCNLQYAIFDKCNDLCLDSVAKFCPKIKSIEFGMENISSNGLKCLCCRVDGAYACSDLREIIIHNCDAIRKKDILYLFHMFPMLENFDCELIPKVLYSIHKDDMQTLDNIKPYNLTKLSLINCMDYIFDILKICVTVCPNLTSLACHVNSAEHLNLCSMFPKLQKLLLKGFDNQSYLDISNFLLLKGNMLTSLEIFHVSLLTTTLLMNCSNLKVLKMENIRLHYPKHDDFHVPVNYNLKELYINYLDVLEFTCMRDVALFLSSCLSLQRLQIKEDEDSMLCYPEIQVAILRCCEAGTLEYVKFEWSNNSFQLFHDVLLTCTSLKTFYLHDFDLNFEHGDYEYLDRLINTAKTLPNKPIILYKPDQPVMQADFVLDLLEDPVFLSY